MDKKDKFYIDMVKLIDDFYKLNNRDYRKTLEDIIMLKNIVENDLIDKIVKILSYIEKLYISFDKKIDDIREFEGDMMIKTGIDNSYNHLLNIYKHIYKNDKIDIDIMLLIIIPSITIKMTNNIEIIDFTSSSKFNNRILNIVCQDNFRNDCCSICLEKCKKMVIMSNCCCNKTCVKCFQLNYGKCAICKDINPVIIRF
jgi:hypothetical protein